MAGITAVPLPRKPVGRSSGNAINRNTKTNNGALTRRRLLHAALGGIAAMPVLVAGAARGQAPGRLEVDALRGGLVRIGGAGGNVVLLRGAEGAALVDSGAPAHAAELGRLIAARLGGAPVELLFNTHWHLEHTGGNDDYGAAGTRIVAHANTKLWMLTEYYVDWQDRTYPPRQQAALPTNTFYGSDPHPVRFELGTETIECGYLREAHTDGDIYVFFPERNVLVAGGAVGVAAFPVPDHATGGWIGGLEDATRTLLDIADSETLIVPARGPAQRRTHLDAQLDMVATVRGRIGDLMRKGYSAEDMLAAGVTDGFDAAWGGNRERFVANVYDGLWWQGRLDGSL